MSSTSYRPDSIFQSLSLTLATSIIPSYLSIAWGSRLTAVAITRIAVLPLLQRGNTPHHIRRCTHAAEEVPLTDGGGTDLGLLLGLFALRVREGELVDDIFDDGLDADAAFEGFVEVDFYVVDEVGCCEEGVEDEEEE